MKTSHVILILTLTLLTASASWGQDTSGQQPGNVPPDSAQPQPQQPVPAYGEENPAPLITDNPPISGLDTPNLEPHAAPLSYLQAGAHGFETIDSNIQNSVNGTPGIHDITVALGSLELQRLWRNYDLAIDYLGGAGYYTLGKNDFKLIQEMGVNQKITWKRGQLGIRDAFSYQPEGTFGSAYGSVASTGAGLGGENAFFGGTVLGSLGQVPRIMNISTVDMVENLSPKSALTVAAGYGFVHFLDNNLGTTFIGNSQFTAQAGYDRLLGPRDQAALVFGYQQFHFSTGLSFKVDLVQFMWGHRSSGRMDFLIAAGPQVIQLDNVFTPATSLGQIMFPPCTFGAGFQVLCPTNDIRLTAAGRARLRYQFSKASMDIGYNHYTTSGSGFFAGAETDLVHVDLIKPLRRNWTVYGDTGYTRNSRVLPSACVATPSNPCPGVTANVYQYGFIGGGVRRMISHDFRAFASYQFNDLYFDSSFCQSNLPCNRTSLRSTGTIGLDWTPRPMRLD